MNVMQPKTGLNVHAHKKSLSNEIGPSDIAGDTFSNIKYIDRDSLNYNLTPSGSDATNKSDDLHDFEPDLQNPEISGVTCMKGEYKKAVEHNEVSIERSDMDEQRITQVISINVEHNSTVSLYICVKRTVCNVNPI